MGRIHVVGAGMAGLAAALRLSSRTSSVAVYEAAGHAGGRCRSFHDDVLDHTIDNGNHLLLSGNTSVAELLAETGAADSLPAAADARLPFVDLETGERWTIDPNDGRLPWWIFAAERRVKDSGALDYLAALKLAMAKPTATVADLFSSDSNMYRRFWSPVTIAILNTPPDQAMARLLWPVMVEIFGRGGRACRPRFAREGLSQSLVDPTIATLRRRDAEIFFNARLRKIDHSTDTVRSLVIGGDTIDVAPSDAVILAVAAPVAGSLLDGLETPSAFHPIVNIHFRLPDHANGGDLPPILGVIGGTAEWIFCRRPIVSVTISAADAHMDEDPDALAEATWNDISRILGVPSETPNYRIIREKRATFAQTPAQEHFRPDTQTRYRNLFLAGDWTATGLPAT
ncbi:MAG: hydroxysqualene dehydroxylase HpnE, partial [Pseudomonadota bacterium]